MLAGKCVDQVPSCSRWLWGREAKCANVKNFIFIEALSQHKAVLRKQSSVKIVHSLKESIT